MDGENGSEVDSPPERLPSDTIQLIFLLVVLVIGLPSNCLVFRRILALCKASRKDSVKTGFLLLNLNLAISDIMLLLLYALPKLLWNLTYEWKGTDAMCKTHKYLSMASYYLSSNIIVCIAIDRLRNVLGASKIRRANTRSIRVLIFFAWFLAFFLSSPQLVVFQTVDVLPDSGSWIQCSDVWTINSFQDAGSPLTAPEWLLQSSMQAAYELAHLLLVFWGPLAALSICYAIIAIRLARYSINGPQPTSSRLGSDASDAHYLVDADGVHAKLVVKRKASPLTMSGIISTLAHKRRQSSMVPQNSVLIQPMWRRKLRGKLFRSTLLIVAAHFLLWFPYNFAALFSYLSDDFKEIISTHAFFLNDLQILITIVNPMLYAIVQ